MMATGSVPKANAIPEQQQQKVMNRGKSDLWKQTENQVSTITE